MKQLIEQLYADGDMNQNAYIKLTNAVIGEPACVKTKEERFKELIEGIDINRPVVDFEKYPTSLFWFKGDKCYFEYDWKTQVFKVNWSLIWSIFEKEYGMKYIDIQAFIKVIVEEHFKLNGITPIVWGGFFRGPVEEHFKLKGVTPNGLSG